MLHSVKRLEKAAVLATDGEVGKLRDVFFDDAQWVLRYLVVDTGGWLRKHLVLLSPYCLRDVDWDRQRIEMELSREKIESSPGVDSHLPLSRRMEALLAQHYGIPFYWSGPQTWGNVMMPAFSDLSAASGQQTTTLRHELDRIPAEDRHLRSCNEVGSYTINASDGKLGHVVDFLFDQDDWSIQYLVVDPRNLWPSRKVLIPVSRIEKVHWTGREVTVAMTREQVAHSPDYDPDHLPPSAAQARPGAASAANQPRA